MPDARQMVDQLLGLVRDALTEESARRLVDIRVDPTFESSVIELGDRANDGQLTDQEKSDFDFLLTVANVVSLLQAKARSGPKSTTPAA